VANAYNATITQTADDEGNITGTLINSEGDNVFCANQERRVFDELIAQVAEHAQQTLVRAANDARNTCEARNGGSGAQENFIWAELSQTAGSTNFDWNTYAVRGLANADIVRSSNIWGGFCAVRVSMIATDTNLNATFTGNTRYFSVGDTIICGSWLTDNDTRAIERRIRDGVRAPRTDVGLATVMGGLVTAVGGNMVHNMTMNSMNQNTTEGRAACNIRGSCVNNCNEAQVVDLVGRTIFISICGNTADVDDETRGRQEACNRERERLLAGAECVEVPASAAGNRRLLGFGDGSGGIAWGNVATTAVTGALGAWGSNAMARAHRDAQHEQRRDAAVNEWFDSIGQEIQCVVGGRPAGRFGDVIEIR
jgi:hypothetical protein